MNKTWNSGHCGEGAARSKSDPNYYAELVLDDAVDAVIFVVVIINVVAAYVAVLQSQDQARPTAWGGWGYCDTLCSKAKTFGWEGQLKLLEVSTPLKDGIIWRKKQYESPPTTPSFHRWWGKCHLTASASLSSEVVALRPSCVSSKNKTSGPWHKVFIKQAQNWSL